MKVILCLISFCSISLMYAQTLEQVTFSYDSILKVKEKLDERSRLELESLKKYSEHRKALNEDEVLIYSSKLKIKAHLINLGWKEPEGDFSELRIKGGVSVLTDSEVQLLQHQLDSSLNLELTNNSLLFAQWNASKRHSKEEWTQFIAQFDSINIQNKKQVIDQSRVNKKAGKANLEFRYYEMVVFKELLTDLLTIDEYITISDSLTGKKSSANGMGDTLIPTSVLFDRLKSTWIFSSSVPIYPQFGTQLSTPPIYAQGSVEIVDFIIRRFRVPESAFNSFNELNYKLFFMVLPSGELEQIQIIQRGQKCEECEMALIDAVKEMTSFQPSTLFGIPVMSHFILPLKISL